MKAASAFVLATLVTAVLGKDAPMPAGLMELQGDHVVLIEGSQSADGRYAVGWTVRPEKGQPPVQWSEYGKEDGSFLEDYCDHDGYVVTNVLVNLSKRVIAATLPFTNPYFSHKGHGALEAAFGPESEGHRFGLALTAAKWNATDVVLVDLAGDGVVFTDILKMLDGGVGKYIASQSTAKNPLNPERYATQYRLAELPEAGLLTGFADAEKVRLPFASEVPKVEEARLFTGTIQLRLSREKGKPHAEVVEVRETKDDPDPVQDHPQVAAADKELNAAYTAAKNLLNAAGKAKLLEEQRAWIKDRDERLQALRTKLAETPVITNPRFETDRLLLQLTKERAAALRGK